MVSQGSNVQMATAGAVLPSNMASIKELSERIACNSALVEEWLTSKNAKVPSFEQDADEEFPATAGEAKIEEARLAVLDDTNTLHDMLIGPGEVLRRICWGVSRMRHCVHKLWRDPWLRHTPRPLTMPFSNAYTTSTSSRPSR